MAMSMMKEAWLERFGWCKVRKYTRRNRRTGKGSLDGMPTGAYVWSEFERQCEPDSYFTGTRWTDIVSGVRRDAARFYFREKPSKGSGCWCLAKSTAHTIATSTLR